MHTSAPNSMSAAEKRGPFSAGNSSATAANSRFDGCGAKNLPSSARAYTRRTLVSTTGTFIPKWKHATARAV